MNWLDILLVAVPFAAVMAVGFQTRRYVRGVVDFLSAGRLCGRYLLTVGDIANGISIVGVLSYLERKYKVGFAVDFWNRVLIPVTITLALTGYCIYRFRETRALSAGQFLEMRYGSRGLRFYFSFVRVLAEMLAHSIMPAVAARFFMYFLGLPEHFTCCGATFSTFVVLMVGCMACAIALICWGGLLTIVVTDTLQGLLCVPLMLLFGLFLLTQFSWGRHILPVLLDRVGGESFVNSFDVKQVRDFNIFAIIVSLTTTILHRATWLGGGASGAARTPHEQKMASLLGQWRGLLGTLLYTLLALSMMVLLNHHDFAPQARSIRTELAVRVARDIVADPPTQARVVAALEAVPEHTHHPGEGAPLSHKSNLETPYLEAASAALGDTPTGRAKSQEFSSLYKQQMVSVTLRHLFGHGLLGLFMLLMILAMVSTDDSYIFSSVLTIVQDLILPFFKRPPSPRLHIWLLRGAAIGVGAFFLVCSLSLAQLDYIELFRMSVLPMYLGGCGPVMVFGLYGRFGTKQGGLDEHAGGDGAVAGLRRVPEAVGGRALSVPGAARLGGGDGAAAGRPVAAVPAVHCLGDESEEVPDQQFRVVFLHHADDAGAVCRGLETDLQGAVQPGAAAASGEIPHGRRGTEAGADELAAGAGLLHGHHAAAHLRRQGDLVGAVLLQLPLQFLRHLPIGAGVERGAEVARPLVGALFPGRLPDRAAVPGECHRRLVLGGRHPGHTAAAPRPPRAHFRRRPRQRHGRRRRRLPRRCGEVREEIGREGSLLQSRICMDFEE